MLTRKFSWPTPIRSLTDQSGHQEQPTAIRNTWPAGQPGKKSLRPRKQTPSSSTHHQAARRTRQKPALDKNCPRCPIPIRNLKDPSVLQEPPATIRSTKPAGQPGKESLRPRKQTPSSSTHHQTARRTKNAIQQHKLKVERAGTKTSWTPPRKPAGECF